MTVATKDPRKVKAGIAGSAARWGGRRIVRLDALDPTVRAVIVNLVETAERIARERADSPEAA